MSTHTSRSTSRLEFRHGRPVIIFNGEPISHAIASDPVVYIKPLAHSTPGLWLERNRYFRDSGVHNYSVQPVHWVNGNFSDSRFWTGDGVYPIPDPNDEPFCLDKQAQALIDMDPDARFFMRFGDLVPKTWYDANPEHTQQNYSGEPRMFFSSQISLASEKGLQDLCRYFRHLVTYCENQPWADRIFAYTYLPHGEGIPNLNVSGMVFDVCGAMQQAFRKYVREQYADETALQAAWGDPEITFDTVRVPIDPEWREALTGVEHWIEGDQLRRFRDYFHLQRELFLHWYRTIIREVRTALTDREMIFGIDMCKQHQLGWQHNLFFGGYGPSADYLEMFNAGGSIDVGELLDEPGLDMLLTPGDYTARNVGYGWEPEGIADSLMIRGKAIFIENDSRTFCTTGNEQGCMGAFRTIEEVRAGFLRNTAWLLTRGGFDEWGLGGGGYFDHPLVQEHGIQPCTRLLDAAPNWPHRETEHAVAMIIDDTSPWYEDGTSGYQNLACFWQRVIGLAHCGIPYRIYLFSDLLKENMPDYRCYLFLNLFKMDEERMDLLRRKVFRDGRMAIFGPASGITDGDKLGAEWATRLLGVEMELVRKHAPRRVIVQGPHPIAQALPASTIYGDSQPYGPILIPAENAVETAGAESLGWATTFWGINRPGLLVKDHGTHKIAWSVAVPLPANLLRELARYGGCNVWCEEDDVILASDSIAAVHSVKAGSRTLHFPTPRTVWNLLTGEKLGDGLREITVHITPPQTSIFYFGEQSPF
ncbi:MAG: hypothetical protein ACYDBB_25580 [Armatimonadota bacterium]